MACEVQSFLGLVSFSSRFISDYVTISEPLRELTRKNGPFTFGTKQRAAFEALKSSLANANKLAYFDKDATTKVIADASPVGLGAVLVQIQKKEPVVISNASRSLSECERRYSQTKKEALALVWACEKFHPYIYGGKFTIITDHKPLEAIYNPRSKPCARIERWVLRLQGYDLEYNIYLGRKLLQIHFPDLAHKLHWMHGRVKEKRIHVQFMTESAIPRAFTLEEIEKASEEDGELRALRECIASGKEYACAQKFRTNLQRAVHKWTQSCGEHES